VNNVTHIQEKNIIINEVLEIVKVVDSVKSLIIQIAQIIDKGGCKKGRTILVVFCQNYSSVCIQYYKYYETEQS